MLLNSRKCDPNVANTQVSAIVQGLSGRRKRSAHVGRRRCGSIEGVDGRTAKRAKQLAVVVIVVGAVLGLVEAAVRARSSVFPPPPRWVGPEMPLKERQIEFLERFGGASVAFVGSSVVDVAVDPSALPRGEDERASYNASTGAGSLRMIATWTRVLAVPKLRPDVVVLGIISRELNANDPEQ